MHTIYVDWGEARIKLTWVPGAEMPPADLVTSIHGVCFWQGQILLVDLKRGTQFPGGHLEAGETLEQCLERELLEEGYVRVGRRQVVGHMVVDHSENRSWQPGGKYPRVGYQLFYRVEIDEVLPYVGEYEAAGRRFVDPERVPLEHTGWNEMLQLLLDAALTAG